MIHTAKRNVLHAFDIFTFRREDGVLHCADCGCTTDSVYTRLLYYMYLRIFLSAHSFYIINRNRFLKVFIFVIIISEKCNLIISVQGDCAGKADIIIAVPGSVNIPGEEFFPFETFLHMLVDYFVLDENNVNVGFVLYGNEPTILSHPQPFKDQAETNTRATLLTQRENYMNILGSPPNVARALNLMRAMFQNPSGYPMERPRRGVKKIGVIFTWGAQPIEAFDDVVRASDDLRMDGVTMYAVGRSPIGPEFARLATDECKLFSMGNFQEGLPSVLPYLGSSICTRKSFHVLCSSLSNGRLGFSMTSSKSS